MSALQHQAKLQSKLTVSEPGDAFEEEADRVAYQVMRILGILGPMQVWLQGESRQSMPVVTLGGETAGSPKEALLICLGATLGGAADDDRAAQEAACRQA